MNELNLVTNENGVAMTTSLKIAEVFGKEHKTVIRSIKNIIKKNPELSDCFTESFYINLQNKKQPMYNLTTKGKEVLENAYKYNVRSARLEYKILNEIKDFCDKFNIKYECQYRVLNYKIDMYIPDINLAIEIDEIEHNQKIIYDEQREKDIVSEIHCSFFRIKESDNKSIGTILGEFVDTYIRIKKSRVA